MSQYEGNGPVHDEPLSQAADYLPKLARSVELAPSKTALVVVDMQYATASRDHGLGKRLQDEGTFEFARWRFDRAERVVIPNIALLLDAFRAAGLPVVFTQNGAEKPDYSDAPPLMRDTYRATNNHVGTREHQILDELEPLPTEFLVRKTTVGAFASSGIDSLLRSLGAEVLVFCGYSSNMCLDQTARVAADLGYSCIIVEDGSGAATQEYHRAALVTFARLFGRIATTAEMLAELTALEARSVPRQP